MLAAYTYADARLTKTSPLFPDQVGDRTNGVPYNQASLWGDYGFDDLGVPGLKIGACARYMARPPAPTPTWWRWTTRRSRPWPATPR